MWHTVWEALLQAEGPLSVKEIMAATGLKRVSIESALVSLSGHWVPVYEEQRGGTLYFGVANRLSHEKVDEIIRYTNNKEEALGRRVDITFADKGQKEQ